MYVSLCSFFEKYVLNVQGIHNAWKWTCIMVIRKCCSRMCHMWQYLISSQVLYGCTLNTDFLFDNRYWHAVDLRYKRNLLPCVWSILVTLKVMLSQCDGSVLTHNGISKSSYKFKGCIPYIFASLFFKSKREPLSY